MSLMFEVIIGNPSVHFTTVTFLTLTSGWLLPIDHSGLQGGSIAEGCRNLLEALASLWDRDSNKLLLVIILNTSYKLVRLTALICFLKDEGPPICNLVILY